MFESGESKKLSLGMERNRETADRRDCMEEKSSKESTDCLGRKLGRVGGHTPYSCKLGVSVYASSKFYSKYYSN